MNTRTKNIIYVIATFILCVVMCIFSQRTDVAINEIFIEIISETNVLLAVALMDSENSASLGILVIYGFISRGIYAVLDKEDKVDSILQVIGNCFLQAFIVLYFMMAPIKDRGSSTMKGIGCLLLGTFTILLIIAMVRSSSPFKVYPKFFYYLYQIPIVKGAIAIFLALIVQLLILLLIALPLSLIHLDILIFPISFIIAPTILNPVSERVFNFISKKQPHERLGFNNACCFIFAILVMILVYMP